MCGGCRRLAAFRSTSAMCLSPFGFKNLDHGSQLYFHTPAGQRLEQLASHMIFLEMLKVWHVQGDRGQVIKVWNPRLFW